MLRRSARLTAHRTPDGQNVSVSQAAITRRASCDQLRFEVGVNAYSHPAAEQHTQAARIRMPAEQACSLERGAHRHDSADVRLDAGQNTKRVRAQIRVITARRVALEQGPGLVV